MFFEIQLVDDQVEEVTGADSYEQEGPMTTFFARERSQAFEPTASLGSSPKDRKRRQTFLPWSSGGWCLSAPRRPTGSARRVS
jgi:hypothetical protein